MNEHIRMLRHARVTHARIYRLPLNFMTRNERIAAHIAKAIVRNTKKRFGTLYADAIEETKMATPTSSNGLNTSAHSEASLDRSKIGSPADGRKLNSSGVQGTDINSGIAASQNSEVKPVTVKPVDSKTITGSYAGDHRSPSKDTAKESLNTAADNGGPRSRVGQFPLSSKTPAAPAPQSFLGADSTDQN